MQLQRLSKETARPVKLPLHIDGAKINEIIDEVNIKVPYTGAINDIDVGIKYISSGGLHVRESDAAFGPAIPAGQGITILYDTFMGFDGMIFCYDFSTMVAKPLTIVADTLEFDAEIQGMDFGDADVVLISDSYGGKFIFVGDARTGFQCNSSRYNGSQFGMGVNAGGGLIGHHIAIRDAGTGYTTDDILGIEQTPGGGGEVYVNGVDEFGGVTSISLKSAGTGYIIADDNETSNDGLGADCTIDITEVTIAGYVFLQSNNGGSGGITYPIQIFIDAVSEYEFSDTRLNLGSNDLLTTGDISCSGLTFDAVTKKKLISLDALGRGSTAPSLVRIGNFAGYEYDINDDSYFTFEPPEDWKVGTDLKIKVYWYVNEPYADHNAKVRWQGKYSCVPDDGSEAIDAPTHTATINTGDINIPAVAKGLTSGTLTIPFANIDDEDVIGILFSRIAIGAGTEVSDGKPTIIRIELYYQSNIPGKTI